MAGCIFIINPYLCPDHTSTPTMTTTPLKVFIIYAHEDNQAVEQLRKQLVSLEKKETIELWHDGKILPGQKWDETIKNRLDEAELVLLCVSVDFINSAYIEDTELKKVLQRHRDGQAHLVPVILRHCDWAEYFEIGQFQALPNKARPVYSSHFPYVDEAFYEIQQGIRSIATNLLEKRAARQRAETEAARSAEAEKNRAKRAQQLDDAAWQAALDELEAADIAADKIIALDTYLDDPAHTRHRDEAERLLADIKTADTRRQIAEKKHHEAKKHGEGLGMVFVKGGTFNMGNQFQVTLSDYAIGKYPVTQKLWKDIMGNNPSRSQGDELPVERVSWDDCQQFLQKLNERYPGKNYRLPTEAEWEFAARGGVFSKGYEYAGSSDLDEVGWYSKNSDDKTYPVGQKKANELGIFDMSGNVWEWCQDWYGDYPSGPVNNWCGPDKGRGRVSRGGSWFSGALRCRVAFRSLDVPSRRFNDIGFRLACSS